MKDSFILHTLELFYDISIMQREICLFYNIYTGYFPNTILEHLDTIIN